MMDQKKDHPAIAHLLFPRPPGDPLLSSAPTLSHSLIHLLSFNPPPPPAHPSWVFLSRSELQTRRGALDLILQPPLPAGTNRSLSASGEG